MRKLIVSAACAAMVGTALAQVEASSSVYLLDIDPAHYAGPDAQRLLLRVGDQPRTVTIGAQETLCVQLERVDIEDDKEVIRARVRALGPESKAAEVRVVAPDIVPGTYRSTPWGLLLRALPGKVDAPEKVVGVEQAPVCTI